MILSVISLLLSLAALGVALAPRRGAKKPPDKPPTPAARVTRQQQAVARREWENFMHYEGDEQLPIDPDRVLGD